MTPGDRPPEPDLAETTRRAEPPAPAADASPIAPVSPWKAVLLAAVVIACVAVVWWLRDYVAPLREFRRPPWIDDLRRRADDAGLLGQGAFVLAAALGVAVGLPRLAFAFVGGGLFGWIEGCLLAQAGSFLGCWATFEGGRRLGREWVRSFVARKLPRSAALLDFISRHGFVANLTIRLTPVGHAFTTNLLFAMSSIPRGTFLLATFLGTFPETIAVALVGSAVKGTEMVPRIVGGALAMTAVALVVAVWTRRMRRRAGG